MKKLTALLLTGVLAFGVLTGCGDKAEETAATQTTEETESTTEAAAEETETETEEDSAE